MPNLWEISRLQEGDGRCKGDWTVNFPLPTLSETCVSTGQWSFQMQAEWTTWSLQYVFLLKCIAHNVSSLWGWIVCLISTKTGMCFCFLQKSIAVDKIKQYKNIVIIFGNWYYWSWKLQYSSNCTCLTTAHSVFLYELTISETPFQFFINVS